MDDVSRDRSILVFFSKLQGKGIFGCKKSSPFYPFKKPLRSGEVIPAGFSACVPVDQDMVPWWTSLSLDLFKVTFLRILPIVNYHSTATQICLMFTPKIGEEIHPF